ncbi:MAG: site-specific integrase [Nitrospinota bacterium]|nr:site-specific integrase [Nitrospinota bacterium]
MAKFAKAKNQAAKAVRGRLALGQPRHDNKQHGRIHSIRTADHYERHLSNVAQWLENTRAGHGLPKLTAEEAMRYLNDKAAIASQSEVDQCRQAMECHLGRKLSRVRSEQSHVSSGRSYSSDQLKAIRYSQSERNAFSTQIADAAGLRAHELLTIAPISERPPSEHRNWDKAIFAGREDWKRYTVIGKGGLCREVRLPSNVASRLEERRLAMPESRRDRGVNYLSRYDLPGGNSWSKSFGEASLRVLGFSNGAHGCRHSFAQRAMETYQSRGYSYCDSLASVAQELGHFHPKVTEVYLR